MLDNYAASFEKYKHDNRDFLNELSDDFAEMTFEKLYRHDCMENTGSLIEWYARQVQACQMSVERIPLMQCKGWRLSDDGMSIVHHSGEFFRVDGIRVSNSRDREVSGGWEQPILTQVGYDGGILGLIRMRIDGVPHYLVEAKAEPGNPNIVQISTTVQATFSNIKQAHGGNRTNFVDYFINPESFDARVIFERWMSEDGGRLFNKRNKSMIVEVKALEVPASERYKWLTLNQLVNLTRATDAIVAPHIRGILAVI